ncbi:hypothetical protein MPLB_2040058 [Mesorhizobium sp. ORS 3324]|nr:hypothetical protein MPLB_2040058 [Mesorhizobium sp. ORS 3324]
MDHCRCGGRRYVLGSVPKLAQQQPARLPELTGFWLTTPHPELAIPRKTETIPLAFVWPNATEEVKLKLTPPLST